MGTRVRTSGVKEVIKIIPTRMGTRGITYLTRYGRRDHPHAYGDKRLSLTGANFCRGSSPRVWGQEENNYSHKITSRIIPTRMGTRFPVGSFERKGQDHPHAYGDKLGISLQTIFRKGSSPCVWGQDKVLVVLKCKVGIIPTRMGTRCHFYPNHRQRKDHPHAYGDKKDTVNDEIRAEGSSPRVWGQVRT